MDIEWNESFGSRKNKCEHVLRNVATKRGVRIDGFVRLGEAFEQVKANRKVGIQNTRKRILDGVRILRGRFCA